ncbi:hypothetical protein DA096_04485 [Vibrio rotiferianus]|uniref:Uncharacterized protein n=1 Tax=Vibrio rotiferianus TaxID=190895 RepID=A0A7Y3Z820_9VIBR|nr:hypothetical protein [Vibrio rotiferianus]NOH67350.1 hypothetical protein [Vibrio rotiferianus]TMX42152.1 hypothetical protein DA095_06295 [Vibrio rotiferianus]TMX58307.1 hypothetical protein DA093_04345 [Vibrio rotiferianus]TMX59476.1 hypothetical protein DA097_17945 [Vibrio rotiferianus]
MAANVSWWYCSPLVSVHPDSSATTTIGVNRINIENLGAGLSCLFFKSLAYIAKGSQVRIFSIVLYSEE